MNKPVRDLIIEHGGIMLMLSIMQKVAQKLRNGNNINKESLNKIVEFLNNFADKCHHGKEEGILFPELLKDSSSTKLINEPLGEHKTGRDYIRGIAESIKYYAPGNPYAVHIAVNAEGYVRLLAEHIKKENTVLFPVAGKQITPSLEEQLMNKFEILEKDVIGKGKHEEYHGWLKELKKVYLN